MTFYFLLLDGDCCQIEEANKNSAITKAIEWFDFDSFDDFNQELNLIEYKTDEFRYIHNWSEQTITKFDVDTEYQLESFLTIIPSKKPVFTPDDFDAKVVYE